MVLDILLVAFGIVSILLGLLGCILPVIPGPPLSFAGLLFLHFTRFGNYSTLFLVILGSLALIITILDFFIPIWGTKKMGGTKHGVTGSMVGLILGLFFPPVGIILGPFIGAVVGELINGSDTNAALKSGLGSLIGFLLGTGLKLSFAFTSIYYFIKEFFQNI